MMNSKLEYILIILIAVFIQTEKIRAAIWVDQGEMPSPVYDGVALVYGSDIYILGGYSAYTDLPSDTIQVFSPEDNNWSIAGHMTIPRAGFLADVYENTIVIIGGLSVDTLETSNIETWSITEKASANIGINDTTNRINAVGGIHNGSFYIFGGFSRIIEYGNSIPYIMEYQLDGGTTFNYAEEYSNIDPQIPYQQMSALYQDDFYLLGGVFFVPTKKVYKFSTVEKNLEQLYPNLPEAIAGGSAVTGTNGNIHLIGGFNESSEALNSMYIFTVDQFGYTLSNGVPLNYARKECMAVNYQDSAIYVFGGLNDDGQVVTNFERYDLNDNDVTDIIDQSKSPRSFKLNQNYPNPFNAGTSITFDLSKPEQTRLSIFDTAGRLVRELANGILPGGRHQYMWDGTDYNNNPVGSNIYILQLITESGSESRKMVMVK